MKKELSISRSQFIKKKLGKIEEDYELLEEVCSAAFSTVRKVRNKKTNKICSMNIIKKTKNENTNKLHLEIEILRHLTHPNIIQIYEFYEDKKNFSIISEICEGVELFNELFEKGIFNEEESANIIKQLLSTVNYIHSKNIVHRDLNFNNILIDSKHDNTIKIVGWRTARYYESGEKKMNVISGTPHFVAPEVLYENYDEKCDIWSCGIILYILLCGYPPFDGDNNTEILEKIQIGKFDFPEEDWSSISINAKNLISSMLKFNPNERLSAADCLKHLWIVENIKQIDVDLSDKCLNNMNKFGSSKGLQKAVLIYISTHLITNEEKNEFAQLFHSFDKNGDGEVSEDEIYEGYKKIMSENEAKIKAKEIMMAVDTDNSGTIDYNEFVIAAMNKKNILEKKRLKQAFEMFDHDNSGSISIEELKSIFGNNKDVQKSFENFLEKKLKKNKEINFDEFYEIMKLISN